MMSKKQKYDPTVYSVFKSKIQDENGDSVDGWCGVLIKDSRLKVNEATRARAIKSIVELHQDMIEADRKYG